MNYHKMLQWRYSNPDDLIDFDGYENTQEEELIDGINKFRAGQSLLFRIYKPAFLARLVNYGALY